jgi:hypothetical protein
MRRRRIEINKKIIIIKGKLWGGREGEGDS